MASGEGSKRPQDANSADRASGPAPDGLTPGGERVAKRASRKAQTARKSRVLPLSVALVALASAGAIVWYGKGGFQGAADGEIPIISASETPDRVAPDEPGGLQIPFQDNAVLNNGETAGAKVERILPPPEEPLALDRPPKPEMSGEGSETMSSETMSSETMADVETPSHDASPMVSLNGVEESDEVESESTEAAVESGDDSDPIGDLVARMTDGQSAESDSTPVPAPPVPEPPQVATGEGEESPSSDAESEIAQGAAGGVVPARISREVGGSGDDGDSESLMAEPAEPAQQAEVAKPKKATKTREIPIVLPPQVPTVDLPNGEEPATRQASEPRAPQQQDASTPQLAKASPAVVTKEVEQPAKKANGKKVEQLPTEQKPAKPIQVAQPRMTDLPKNSYIIQVAALRSEAEAEGFWSKAQAKHPDLLETMPLYVERADLGDRGIYFRVQTGPFPSKATAQDLCGQLKSAGQDCIVKRRK